MGGESAYTRLLSITRDHEAVCSNLMASTRQFEEQIRSLRIEHEALRAESQAMRRCLDRAGVLPAVDVEKELQQASGKSFSPSGRPVLAAISVDDVGSTSASFFSPTSPDFPVFRPVSAESELSASPLALSNVASSPTLSSARGPSHDSSPLKRMQPPAAARVEINTEPQDLFELCRPLLERGASATEQQRSLRVITQVLKDSPDSVHIWSGPSTPLHAAVKASRVDLVRALLRAKADANEHDAKGVSALHLATFDGNAEIVRALVMARADANFCDRHGQTPLFFAPTREVCKLLLEKKADITILNRKGQSALHVAGRAGLQEVLAWLSARVTRPMLELKDVHGHTARNYAQQTGLPTSSKELTHWRAEGSDSGGVDVGLLPSVSEVVEDGDSSLAGSSHRDEKEPEASLSLSKSAPSLTPEAVRRSSGSDKPQEVSPAYPVKSWSTQDNVAAGRRSVPTAPPKPPGPAAAPRSGRNSTGANNATEVARQSASTSRLNASPSRRSASNQPGPPSASAQQKLSSGVGSSLSAKPAESPPRREDQAAASSKRSPHRDARPAASSSAVVPSEVGTTAAGLSAGAVGSPSTAVPVAATVAVAAATAGDAAASVSPRNRTSSDLQVFSLSSPTEDEDPHFHARRVSTDDSIGLEEMYEQDFSPPHSRKSSRLATADMRILSQADLKDAGVLDDDGEDLEDAGVLEDGALVTANGTSLATAGVMGELSATEKQRELDDLAAAGVMDDDLGDLGIIMDDMPALGSQDPVVTSSSTDLAAAGVMGSDLAAAGVVDDDLAAAGVIDNADTDLADLGVLGADDDDLAALGVLGDGDDDLAALGVLGDGDDDLAALGVLGDGDDDLAALGVLGDGDDDLAALGVLGEDDELAELGILGDDIDLDGLGLGLPGLEDDGVFDDDAAALAEAGVLDSDVDADALAAIGIYDGDEDSLGLAEAGVFTGDLGPSPRKTTLASVAEEDEEEAEEEEDGDEYEEGEEGEEEEGEEEEEEIELDGDEEAW